MPFGIVGAGAGGTGGTGGPGSALYGETPETTWHNSVFKVKLKPLTDLADRTSKKVDKVPTDDLLDDFKVGNLVGGISKIDKQAYEGKISRILKNSTGKGFRVFIINKKNEKEIEILPSSVVFINQTDKNVKDFTDVDDDGDSNIRSLDRSAGQSQYNPPVAESRKLKHLLEFNEYIKKI
jgi:soluble cytochrome b562